MDNLAQIMSALRSLLNVCDGAQRRDNVGYNGFDAKYARYLDSKEKWSDVDYYKAWKMLKKYRVQLSSYGIDYDSLVPPSQDAIIKPKFHEKWGSLMMPLSGRISDKDCFSKYKDILKNSGFRWDGSLSVWYIKKTDLSKYNHEQFSNLMSEIGVHVEDMPERDAVEIKQENSELLTVKDVVYGIQTKKLREGYVAVTCENNKFSFHFPFNDILVDLFSNRTGQLTGITEFNVEKKTRETHELEVVLEAIEKIKVALPGWIVVTQGVDEAAEKKAQEIAHDRIPIPAVDKHIASGLALFPFQNEGVRHLLKTGGNALLGYEMGLGKSIISLAYLASEGKRVLVVCPKVVRRTWIQEALRFFPNYFSDKVIELSPKLLNNEGMPDLTNIRLASVNYESLEKFLPAIKAAGFDTIVVDESHRIKSPRAKITNAISSMGGLFKHKILLSGTAVKNKKQELLTQTNFIMPGLFSKYELQMGTIGACWNKLRSTIYIAKQKREVLPELPEQISQIVELEVSGMPGMPDDIGEMQQAKIQAAMAKVKPTVEFVEEILESSDSCCLVFTESVDAALEIHKKLGDVAILHHGQMSDDAREKAKDEFQNENSSKRVFVTTRQSIPGGATLTRADKVIFCDLPWTSADLRQAEARAHRIGQKNCVNVYWMVGKDNQWDTNLTNIIRRKYELNKKINEGKQLTKEEQAWLSKPISLEDIKKG